MVLIWPDKLPRISSDGSDDVVDDAISSSSSAAAIVGWALDEDVIVVIGAVILYSDSSPHQLKKDVTSAISKCSLTTTYSNQSTDLSVIATFHESNNGPDGAYTNINEQNFQKHNDIFIYNPKEAEVWNTQYNQFQRRQPNNNGLGALQNSLVYVSKSNAMFQELASVLKNGSSNKNEKEGNLTLQLQQKLNTIPTKQHNRSYSLLLLHWNSVTDDNRLYQIPVLTALNSIWKERRCSISSITLIIDFVFGLLIGLYLLQYPAKIIQNVCNIKDYHDQLFNDNLNWLQAFPVGFKLNVALTHQIGKEVRRILFYHKRLYSFIAATTTALFGENTISVEQIAATSLQTIGILTTFLGSRFFFAMMFDITRLALLQIHFLSEIFAQCLRYEMSALKSFWLLFNGKKRNILRKRSDNLHYDHMQLLLGMVLFSTCLFVFTTVLVYHWFFAVTNFGATMICCISWSLFMGVEGGIQCEKVILRRRMRSRDNCTWKGDEVQFAPVTLSESISRLDTSYVTCIYNSTESTELQSSRDFLPNVTIESEETCTMKIIFPSESDISIIFAASVSFVVSLTSLVPTLVNRLLFGSRCQSSAASLIDFTNTLISGQR